MVIYNLIKITMSEDKKVSNEIRIGFKTKPKEIISQCEKILQEDKAKDVHLSAVSTSIGDLVIAVEILKIKFPGLFQKNIFSTISPRSSEKKNKPETSTQRLFPRLEIILSKEKPKEEKGESKVISEEEKKILIETLEKQKESYIKIRKSRKYRRPIRKNRRLGYNRRRYSYQTKRNNYNKRRPVYNNNMRFRKSPTRGRGTLKKFKEPRKNSQDKKATAAKN